VLQHIGRSQHSLDFVKGLIKSQTLLEKGVAAIPPPSVTFDVSGDDITAKIQYTDQVTNSLQFITFTVAP